MLKKRGRKAQFYIIAAMIIIAVIISLMAIANYAYVKDRPKKFYDLSSNLNLEGEKIITYGIYQKKDIDTIINNLTLIFSNYLEQTGENTNLIVISGNLNKIVIRTLNKTNSGDITVNIGGDETLVFETSENEILISPPKDLRDNPTLFITFPNNIVHNITLTQGENFVFFLTKSEGLESYIKANSYLEEREGLRKQAK
jgi:hypothetical protein